MNPKVVMGLRILFGIFVLIFGLNKFLGFMPFPPIPGDGGTLMGIYATSGFLKIIGILEILGGVALLLNKYVPLALTFMVAIVFNAFLFHALHDPANLTGAIVGLVLGLILVYANKGRFSSLLSE
ncbi:MAG: putative oxidoreductase [Saprospiraceae bacterium]|jgi:putative oxidoreductase